MIKRFVIFACIAALYCLDSTFAAGKEMSVQLKTGEIKSLPSSLSTVIGTVKYGDRITILEEKNGWMRISCSDGKSGWIHGTALTKEKLQLAAAGKDAQIGASSGEMALAGKGFTAQVEKDFKSKHGDIDFTWIDKMEKFKVPTKDILSFLKEGNVVIPEGGAK